MSPYPRGFIEELYAPRDESRITRADRAFYTKDNARRLDNYRRMMDELPPQTRELLMGPLVSEASVHANTAGVFKGYYKDRRTGIGRFGGSGSDALSRIRGRIVLGAPVLSNFECDYMVTQEDANSRSRYACGTWTWRTSTPRTTSTPMARTTSCSTCCSGTSGPSA